MSKRFRKKAVEVEAVQWTGENREEVEALIGRAPDSHPSPGTWYVRLSSGQTFLRHPRSFEATYDPADQDRHTLDRVTEGGGLERARMMAEELDAAADSWQDRDDLPEHCRRLARRAREIANALTPTQQPAVDLEGRLARTERAAREAIEAADTLALYTHGRSEVRDVAEAKERLARARTALLSDSKEKGAEQ